MERCHPRPRMQSGGATGVALSGAVGHGRLADPPAGRPGVHVSESNVPEEVLMSQERIRPTARVPATLAAVVWSSMVACQPEPAALSVEEAVDSLSIDMFVEHMVALSADEMAGRRPGTAGFDSATAYVIREARALGLEPAGVDGTYRQPILFRRARLEPGTAAFSVGGESLDPGADFSLSPRVSTVETDIRAPLVFAGFGISAPDLGYDDFQGIDVDGKLVVVIRGAPDALGSLQRTVLASRAVREAELTGRGAAGVVVIEPGESSDAAEPPAWSRRAARPRTDFVPPAAAGSEGSEELGASVVVPERVAVSWMERAGRSFDDVHARIRNGEPASFDLGLEGRLTARYHHDAFESDNVVARLPGADPELEGEHLVLTAHLDHLGIGDVVAGDSIYNGTLDNASGSSALLTLASVLTRMEAPRRSVLFLWSEYFARFPTVDPERIVANQNIDGVMGMIAAASDVLAFGYEHSNLSDAVDFAVARTNTPVSPDPTPEENLFIRSDQYAFVRQGIPAIWVQSGRTGVDPAIDPQAELDAWIAGRYHQPSDDEAQPMDLEGVSSELRTNLLVTHYIVNEMGPIRWDPESFLYRRWARE